MGILCLGLTLGMTPKDGNRPPASFSATFGGSGWDVGNSVQQTSDGGYIITGCTNSYGAGNRDVWLIKTDASGNKVWDKILGGTGNDVGNSARQTTDGGYIITGWTDSWGAWAGDAWLIKTDVSGNRLWDKTFGGSGCDVGNSVQQTSDGGYITIGYTESFGAGIRDVWLIKTDSLGNKVWDKTFGGTHDDVGNSVQQTHDGGYVVAGTTLLDGTIFPAIWLIKTDASGKKVWDRTFGGSHWEDCCSVQQTFDGGYIIGASICPHGEGSADVLLIKTDSLGSKVWDRTFGGTSSSGANSVRQTSDGGYIIVGSTDSCGEGGQDVWLIKTDASGNNVWDKTFGGADYDEGRSVQQTSDGGYVVAGSTYSYGAGGADVWLIKTDADGN